MASAALWPSSTENILYFGVQKRLRAFLDHIFTGWGRGGKRHLQRRFLRKRGAAKNEPSQAHCVRPQTLHLSRKLCHHAKGSLPEGAVKAAGFD